MRKLFNGFVLLATVFAACNGSDKTGETDGEPVSYAPSLVPYSVTGTLPHDTLYFTEGLEYYNGILYESSGPGGSEDYLSSAYPSAFGTVNMQTGKVTNKVELEKATHFAEGITFFKDKVYHLTYKNKIGYVFDAKTFKKIREFNLPSAEGWGLTHDSSSIIMSDGTSKLYFLHPDSLTTRHILTVTDNMGEVPSINELEYINGFIYANKWGTNHILKIDAQSGKVIGMLDFSKKAAEAAQQYPRLNEMNGIAYDSTTGTMLVTGKNWPVIYKVRL